MWCFIGGMNCKSAVKLCGSHRAICVPPIKPMHKMAIFRKPLSSKGLILSLLAPSIGQGETPEVGFVHQCMLLLTELIRQPYLLRHVAKLSSPSPDPLDKYICYKFNLKGKNIKDTLQYK